MNTAFSLRERTEKPLIEIDNTLSQYARTINAEILYNYRDYPSRTIYWRSGRIVRYIQLRLDDHDSDYEKNIIYYNIHACSYKILIPLLSFWNIRFDISPT